MATFDILLFINSIYKQQTVAWLKRNTETMRKVISMPEVHLTKVKLGGTWTGFLAEIFPNIFYKKDFWHYISHPKQINIKNKYVLSKMHAFKLSTLESLILIIQNSCLSKQSCLKYLSLPGVWNHLMQTLVYTFFMLQESPFIFDFGRTFNLSVMHPSHICINLVYLVINHVFKYIIWFMFQVEGRECGKESRI